MDTFTRTTMPTTATNEGKYNCFFPRCEGAAGWIKLIEGKLQWGCNQHHLLLEIPEDVNDDRKLRLHPIPGPKPCVVCHLVSIGNQEIEDFIRPGIRLEDGLTAHRSFGLCQNCIRSKRGGQIVERNTYARKLYMANLIEANKAEEIVPVGEGEIAPVAPVAEQAIDGPLSGTYLLGGYHHYRIEQGQPLPQGVLYCGHDSAGNVATVGQFGNPYKPRGICQRCGNLHVEGYQTLYCYEQYLVAKLQKSNFYKVFMREVARVRYLACYCEEDPWNCHISVIVRVYLREKEMKARRKAKQDQQLADWLEWTGPLAVQHPQIPEMLILDRLLIRQYSREAFPTAYSYKEYARQERKREAYEYEDGSTAEQQRWSEVRPNDGEERPTAELLLDELRQQWSASAARMRETLDSMTAADGLRRVAEQLVNFDQQMTADEGQTEQPKGSFYPRQPKATEGQKMVERVLAQHELGTHDLHADLVSAGYIGLAKAKLKLDPAKLGKGGAEAFAARYILGEVMLEMAHFDQVSAPRRMRDLANRLRKVARQFLLEQEREATDAELAVWLAATVAEVRAARDLNLRVKSLDQPMDQDDDTIILGDTIQAPVTIEQDNAWAASQVAYLMQVATMQQRLYLTRLFGLDGSGPKTVTEVAQELGKSHQTVSTVISRAYEKMKVLRKAGSIEKFAEEMAARSATRAS